MGDHNQAGWAAFQTFSPMYALGRALSGIGDSTWGHTCYAVTKRD
jgi:hypothetical protein